MAAAVGGAVAIGLATHGASPFAVEIEKDTHGHGTVTIAWVGDMSLSRDTGLPHDHGRTLLSGVRRPLKTAGLTVGNLEGTLGSGGPRKCPAGTPTCFSFQAPASYARRLKDAGFDALNLANNHAFDYGSIGQAQTIAALVRAGIARVGLPGQITVLEYKDLHIALVGFAPYPWSNRIDDLDAVRELIGAAGTQADIVVAVMHAGGEGAAQTHTPVGRETAFGEDRGDTRGFAHTAVDAGADLVVGSGPHVIRGMEWYRGRLIAYSTGNFLGYKTFGLGGPLSESAILRVTIDQDGRIRGGRWISVRLEPPGLPKRDHSHKSTAHMEKLSKQDFGSNGVRVNRRGRIRVPR